MVCRTLPFLVCLWLAIPANDLHGQQAIDLFSNVPKLGDGFLRIGCWNLQHIEVKEQARELLGGESLEDDYASLIATFAQAIDDLDLHVLIVVEVQPRANEPDRLVQLRDKLNHLRGGNTSAPADWQSLATSIEYDEPDDPYGNLQFGLLWQSARAQVDVTGARLLDELRQPRDAANQLTRKENRSPWLVPVRAGELQFDLLALHLKSGGMTPQAAEVAAIGDFVFRRQTAPSRRHLVMLGDWNIRPDQATGRGRLQRLQVPTGQGNLMRILTVEALRPSLEQWAAFGEFDATSPLANLVPFTHFNDSPQYATIDNMLDHLAISSTLDELFDHPVRVQLADGRQDLRPGFEIARPMLIEQEYLQLTDHLPLILTLPTVGRLEPPSTMSLAPVRIVEAVPNPVGPDVDSEEVTLKNFSRREVSLHGWKIGDATGESYWELNSDQFGDPTKIAPGKRVVIRRQGRPMSLDNRGGDLIRLIDHEGRVVNLRTYDDAASGQRIVFE